MTGIFKANNPINNFLLLIYGVLLKLPIFIHCPVPEPQKIDGFLYKALLKWLSPISNNFPLIYPLITFILLFTQAIAINKLANNHRLFPKPNYLVGMCYLLVTSLFKDWEVLSAPLIINSLAIWVLAKMCNLYTVQTVKANLFNIGLIIGIGTFFYFPSSAFLVMVLFGLVIIRPFKLSEWLMILFGALTPFYFLLAMVFLTDKWKGYNFPGIAFTTPLFKETNLVYIIIFLMLGTAITGYFYIQQNFRRQLIQARKTWNLIFLYLFIALLLPFINATHTFSYWVLCAVPFSALMAGAFFYIRQKWIPLILHWVMIGFVFFVGYFL